MFLDVVCVLVLAVMEVNRGTGASRPAWAFRRKVDGDRDRLRTLQ